VRVARLLFAAAAWLYLAGVVVQVFLAGLGVFELSPWTAHAALGWGLGTAPILILVLAIVARPEARTVGLTVALTVAGLVQPELAAARDVSPVLAALHPVNALLVFWLALLVARGSLRDLGHVERHPAEHPASSPSDLPNVGRPD
jgi:hypothetical protein